MGTASTGRPGQAGRFLSNFLELQIPMVLGAVSWPINTGRTSVPPSNRRRKELADEGVALGLDPVEIIGVPAQLGRALEVVDRLDDHSARLCHQLGLVVGARGRRGKLVQDELVGHLLDAVEHFVETGREVVDRGAIEGRDECLLQVRDGLVIDVISRTFELAELLRRGGGIVVFAELGGEERGRLGDDGGLAGEQVMKTGVAREQPQLHAGTGGR